MRPRLQTSNRKTPTRTQKRPNLEQPTCVSAEANGVKPAIVRYARLHVATDLRRHWLGGNRFASAGKMQQLENLAAQAQELSTVALPRARQIHCNSPLDTSRTGCHQYDAIAHVNRFVDVVRYQQHRR